MTLLAIAMQWVIVAIGLVIAISLLYIGLTSGQKILLAAGGAVIIGLVALVVIEKLIVTDEERAVEMLRRVTARAAANDVAGVQSFIHPDAADLKREVGSRLPQYHFDSISAHVRHFDIQDGSSPKRGRITFIAAPTGRIIGSGVPFPNGARVFIELQLEDVADKWLIRGYQIRNLGDAFKKQDKSQFTWPE